MPGFGSDAVSSSATEMLTAPTTRETKFNTSEWLAARPITRRVLGGVALLSTFVALATACAGQSERTGGQGGGTVATAEASDPARAEQEAPHPADVDLGPLTAEHYPSIETPEQAADLVEHWISRQQWAVNELDASYEAAAEQTIHDLYDTTTQSGRSWHSRVIAERDDFKRQHRADGTQVPMSPDLFYSYGIKMTGDPEIGPNKTWFSFRGQLSTGIDTRLDLEMGLPKPQTDDLRYTFRLNDVKQADGSTQKLWQVTEVRAWSDVSK